MASSRRSISLPAIPPTALAAASELERARHWLRFILYSTITTRVYGIDVAVDRALRASLCAWSASPDAARPSSTFYDFITTYFPHFPPSCDEPGVPSNAVMFCLPACARDAPIYRASGMLPCAFHIADIVTTNPTHLLPSTIFVPYDTRSPLRSRQVLDRVIPIPFWFFRKEGGQLGVPIQCNNEIRLLHGQDKLCLLNSNDKPITTLKFRFNWPNYEPLEKQVRASKNSPLNNLDRLANLAANAVCNFMRDEVKKVKIDNRVPHRWDIGTLPGEVSVEDVLLLGVIFVSAGAAMPILAVHDDFVFATNTI